MAPLTRRTLLIAFIVLAGVSGGLLVESLLTVNPDRPFGHTRMGRLTGWVALSSLLLVFGYSIRKRWGPEPRWSKGWFRVHACAGAVTPIVALIHSGAHFHALTPILTMITLAIVSLSGIVGQALHYLVVRTLREQRHDLTDHGLSEGEIEAQLHALAAREKTIRIWQYLHAPVTVTLIVLLVLHIGGAIYFGGW